MQTVSQHRSFSYSSHPRLYYQMVKYIQSYALYESIGSCTNGKVYRAINKKDNKQYAIKMIPIAKLQVNQKLQECTINDVCVLTKTEAHPNIMKYIEMLKTSNNWYFIYEYCNGGTLENLITKQKRLSESNALLIFKQILSAFRVLNRQNITHRDMKPDNILFHNGVLKIGDFGQIKNLNSVDETTKTMPMYMAPEVLKDEKYSNKAVIWSLGVILFEMIFGMCPFESNSIADLIGVLDSKELQFPGPCSLFLKTLITRMLTKDPLRRIDWTELFNIKIDNLGEIESQKITERVSSLNEATILEEGQGQTLQSNNRISKANNIQSEESIREFKKSRNVTWTYHSPSFNTNTSPNINYTTINNPLMSCPISPSSHAPYLINPNNSSSLNSSKGFTSYMIAPSNYKNPVYVMEVHQKPSSNYTVDNVSQIAPGKVAKQILY